MKDGPLEYRKPNPVLPWTENPTIKSLNENPRRWLVTGAAGFIGSNLVEWLLKHDQHVWGLDNLATGKKQNLESIRSQVREDQWKRFHWQEGDIRDLETCKSACQGVQLVLHQAAVGSVPRSIQDPITTHSANTSGFLNMLVAAREAQVDSFVFAASSSTYGDHPDLPRVEDRIGRPLSPYAVTKLVNELYAEVFARVYGFPTVGLRYFNVFGKRQDLEGAYAAVIPQWYASLIKNEPVFINGNGDISRDFCYVDNVIQANLLAALTTNPAARGQIYNIAYGESTTLEELFGLLKKNLLDRGIVRTPSQPVYREFRAGDVRYSLADISKARNLLGYQPEFSLQEGLEITADWYVGQIHALEQQL